MNKAKYLEHTDALFKTLNILPLFQLIKLRTAILMYMVYYGKMPLCILDYLAYSSNVNNTRQCDRMLFLSQTRTHKKQMTISYHGVKLWNPIDANIKDCKNVSSFKNKYELSLSSSTP